MDADDLRALPSVLGGINRDATLPARCGAVVAGNARAFKYGGPTLRLPPPAQQPVP